MLCLLFQVTKQVMGLCFPAEEGNGHQVTCLPWRSCRVKCHGGVTEGARLFLLSMLCEDRATTLSCSGAEAECWGAIEQKSTC